MINWINGHTKDVFKCLVCHDGMFNTLASYYATEELFFPEWEFKGTLKLFSVITDFKI
jgi:dipeptidyl aminopeptidase/acylaminoacyl peptidase